jgi:hypothetical protein
MKQVATPQALESTPFGISFMLISITFVADASLIEVNINQVKTQTAR